MSDIHPTRRDFIRTAAAGATALALTQVATGGSRPPLAKGKAKACIFINMVGGPAHLDTFDPKPDAPADVRGPFRPIRTKTPGTYISELFPKLARVADKFSLIRSMHHDAPPVHECGFQLLNTGRLFRDGPDWPNMGAVMAYLRGHTLGDYPEWAVLPDTCISTGIATGHGQSSGFLDPEHFSPTEPRRCDPDPGYRASLEALCLTAAGVIALGPKFGASNVFVTVNSYDTVFDAPSWDCHADGGSLRTNLNDIRDTVAPSFDTAFAALLTDLEERGLLESTLVVATGEFGRTPKLNSNGGRDHWAGCWTALVAGGGIRGGQVIGRSDRTGSEPADHPVSPQELVASIFHALGVSQGATIPGPDGAPVKVYPGAPVAELFS
jgi:uncharacterized protein (DUF1501 family)